MTRLLIGDDSALMRKLLSGIFADEGDFEIATARNGEEVLQVAARFKPDVATLDIHMPVMDGLECLSRLMLENPCPVVMVSSLTREGAAATLDALALGAIDYVAKPDGALSLHIDQLRPLLVDKVRTAARARPRPSLRLRERVNLQMRQAAERAAAVMPRPRPVSPATAPMPLAEMGGEGLVVIGSSTGGPHALEAILSGLPAAFPLPVVVAQHMPSQFTAIFAERLDRICAVRVVEVAQPTLLDPGHVYIARGDADMVIGRRAAGLMALPAPSSPDHVWHPSVDRLVESAMRHVAPRRLLGVLVTGMGNDGAAAMAALHEQGGRTIAEAEETAIVWGMPGELVRRGGAGIVAPLPEIAAAIVREVQADAAHQA
ncbi:chemotaxis-specific protein-glutamate methyltransferase CheB [Niveispirillum sp. KHB5.9]|uniref:chemotaxis-specific protein-glutamate methyltransferase CheB n=1 Tax=Niveispirillum sp. KHB5.9 TaxID=3400269 RepID=UPI003A89DA4E